MAITFFVKEGAKSAETFRWLAQQVQGDMADG